jgi:alkanesulfonate monooxygenase SsuD/methylene tetrahydromethanopterin reductase-like flavin-dependent oxidoreductase (luciferase family)
MVGGFGHDELMPALRPPRLGFAFTPVMPPERLRPIARAVEAAGLDELWVWEDCFTESGIASAALALGATEHITVGIGLLPVPLRNVALTAMELATLERAIPGRLIAGVGHGVQTWMGQVGARVESPVTLLSEYAIALRRLLDGESVTVDGRYVRLDGVQLGWPPEKRLPLMIGGGGPVTLRLAAELGDGVLLANTLSLDEVDAAAAIAGAEKPLVLTVIAATGDRAAERVDADLRTWRADADQQRQGYAVASGDAASIAAQLLALAGRGVTNLAIEATRDEPDVEGLIAFLGREVRPLLAR